MVGAEPTPDTHHRSSKMLAGNSIIACLPSSTSHVSPRGNLDSGQQKDQKAIGAAGGGGGGSVCVTGCIMPRRSTTIH